MPRFKPWGDSAPGGPEPTAAVPLGPLVAHLAAEAPRWEGARVDLDWLRARLADHCRDAGLRPAPPAEVAGLLDRLDDESRRRAALVASALDLPELRAVAPAVLGLGPIADRIRSAVVEFALGCDLLTLELLRLGPPRVEEFARKWLAALGARVAGESEAESRSRLIRLDYGRLLAEAEQARLDAEPRLEALRKLQQERYGRRARRGKV